MRRGGRKYHRLSESKFESQRSMVGWELKITIFNKALLAKWKWNLFHNKGSLSVNVLKSMYGRLIRGGDEPELKIHFIHCGGRT